MERESGVGETEERPWIPDSLVASSLTPCLQQKQYPEKSLYACKAIAPTPSPEIKKEVSHHGEVQ